MSTFPGLDRERQADERLPFGGDARAELIPETEQTNLGSWTGRVAVYVVELNRARALDPDSARAPEAKSYAIVAEWTGPGLPDLPPAPGPCDVSDYTVVEDLVLAKEVAGRAAELIRSATVPDVRVIVNDLRKRAKAQ